MVNQYRLEEDDEQQHEANTKDIFITVDNPESHVTAIETFIMYRVITKVMHKYLYAYCVGSEVFTSQIMT